MANFPRDEQRETRGHAIPLSIALLNRRSVGGAVAVMLTALFFILVLPALSEMVAQDDLEVGAPVAIGQELIVTPEPDWALSDHTTTTFTVLTNSGAQLIITPASKFTVPVANQIKKAADAIANDPDKSWVVAPATTFATTAGDPGATVTAQSKETSTQTWIVAHDGLQATFVLVAPLAVWDKVNASATAIVESVRFDHAPEAIEP